MIRISGVLVLLLFALINGVNAQQPDSLLVNSSFLKSHSPAKASIYSALLPGLGQVYNRKIWKVPIIYAGFATLGYFIVDNNSEYQRFKNAYKALTDDNPLTIDEFNGQRSADELLFYKDQYRRWRDISLIITVVTYALNIVDANVDAHFFNYDISPDLSMNINPFIDLQGNTGLSLRIGF
jgi:hypothetical protein